MSARLSTFLPRACSGGIYAAVPRIVPATVAPSVTVGEFSGSLPAGSGSSLKAFANPKSSSLTTPSGVTFTLAGFRSRCMTPRSCAYSKASAICIAILQASSNGIGPLGDSPSTNSITNARSSTP
jgi:hypothetical protein